jgi:hypothetical protein
VTKAALETALVSITQWDALVAEDNRAHRCRRVHLVRQHQRRGRGTAVAAGSAPATAASWALKAC